MSKYNFKKLLADPENIASNLRNYINGFSENVRKIIENFDFDKEITRLEKANRLYLIIEEFSKVDLHPDVVSNR
jgi:type I restriction enzyme M protein